MSVGVVIGKFHPPHRGHGALIRTAQTQCDEPVRDRLWRGMARRERGAAGRVDRRVVPQRSARSCWTRTSSDSPTTTARVGLAQRWSALRRRPGPRLHVRGLRSPLREFMGARARTRRSHDASPRGSTPPRSAQAPRSHLGWLDPHVRAHWSHALRDGRGVDPAKPPSRKTLRSLRGPVRWRVRPLLHRGDARPARYGWGPRFRLIAEAQATVEDDAARWGGPPLICDTNPFVTAVFHEAYLGRPDPQLEAAARARRYHLFLVCDPGDVFSNRITPGCGMKGERRAWMHRRYCEYAESHGAPVAHLAGSRDDRRNQAIAAIDPLIGRVRANQGS